MHKNIFTIQPCQKFTLSLVRGIKSKFGNNPEFLKKLTIILPNNRTCKNLKETFLKESENKSVLLPAITTFDNIETLLTPYELNSVISPVKQHLILIKLIYKWSEVQKKPINITQASFLATTLNKLLNEFETEQISLKEIESLNQCENSEYQEEILKFLSLIINELPKILKEHKEITISGYRNIVLSQYALKLKNDPPEYPVIVAGSTGSIPATSELIKAISLSKNGYVILPYTDIFSDESYWNAITESHPQYNIKKLIEKLQCNRKNITDWYKDPENYNEERLKFISRVMRPITNENNVEMTENFSETVLKDIQKAELSNSYNEAYAVAMKARIELHNNKKVAIVTKDSLLSQYISIFLKKWNINTDSLKAGNLSESYEGKLFIYIMKTFSSRFANSELLKCLKHLIIRKEDYEKNFSKYIQKLEVEVLRGMTSKQNSINIAEQIEKLENQEFSEWFQNICKCFRKTELLMGYKSVSFKTIITEHIKVLESLIKNDKISVDFWDSVAGRHLEDFLKEILSCSEILNQIDPFQYSGIISSLIKNQKYYPKNEITKNISILAPIDARMHDFDMVIACGLNEKIWPAPPVTDPWMNQNIRKKSGLISNERITGREAYDFTQIFCAKEVFLTCCKKSGSSLATKNRWLLRIENLCSKLNIKGFESSDLVWQSWINKLEEPKEIINIKMPAPKPPAELRPVKLSATSIETLMRNPYGFYAKKILNLKAMKDIDYDPGGLEFGNLIHKLIDRFFKEKEDESYNINQLPEISLKWQELLLKICDQMIETELNQHPLAEIFWYPKLKNIISLIIETEIKSLKENKKISSEDKGQIEISINENISFTIFAKADRIEYLEDNKTTNIIDYKTGTPPAAKDVYKGFSPQLLVEALIMIKGGFRKERKVKNLEYWELKGTKAEKGKKIATEKNIDALIENTEKSLRSLLEFFNNPDNPYIPCPSMKKKPTYNDYEHLSRIKEWGW